MSSSALFRADAIWTTGGGKRLFGLDEIAAFTRQVLPGGMKGLTITMEVTHVLFIRADVAAVKVRQIYTSSEGHGRSTEAEGEGTPLFVMAKEDGRGSSWPARTPAYSTPDTGQFGHPSLVARSRGAVSCEDCDVNHLRLEEASYDASSTGRVHQIRCPCRSPPACVTIPTSWR